MQKRPWRKYGHRKGIREGKPPRSRGSFEGRLALGRLLKEKRLALGWSQKELAGCITKPNGKLLAQSTYMLAETGQMAHYDDWLMEQLCDTLELNRLYAYHLANQWPPEARNLPPEAIDKAMEAILCETA